LSHAAAADFARGEAPLQALLLGEIAHIVYRQDRYDEAIAIAGQSLAAAGADPEEPAKAQGYQVLGGCALRQGRHEAAMRHFEQAQRCSEIAGDRRKAASSLHNQAVVARTMGLRDEARRRLTQLLAVQKSLGDHAGQSLVLVSLGLTEEADGNYSAAVAHLEEALAIGERHGFVNSRITALVNLGGIAVKLGDEAAARRYGVRALEVATSTGNRYVAASVHVQTAILDARAQRLTEARAGLRTALEAAVALGQPVLIVDCLTAFAELLVATGETACAHQMLAFAAGHADTPPALREDLQRWQKRLPPAPAQRPPPPALGLVEMAARVAEEMDSGHTALRALLRASATL
jgi:tetratricopeptide (TPR) repeat protein